MTARVSAILTGFTLALAVAVLRDGRHEWTVWRHALADVAPRLFK